MEPFVTQENFECDCGCQYFEKRLISQIQLKSPYVADDFIPIDMHPVIKCVYCGSMYDQDGKKVNVSDLEPKSD